MFLQPWTYSPDVICEISQLSMYTISDTTMSPFVTQDGDLVPVTSAGLVKGLGDPYKRGHNTKYDYSENWASEDVISFDVWLKITQIDTTLGVS